MAGFFTENSSRQVRSFAQALIDTNLEFRHLPMSRLQAWLAEENASCLRDKNKRPLQ